MSNVPKLKKRAGEFEQKKQFDKALAVYLQILAELGIVGLALFLGIIGFAFFRRIVLQPRLIPMNLDAGLILGAIAGGAIGNGYGAEFAEFVTAHGVIELTRIPGVKVVFDGYRFHEAVLQLPAKVSDVLDALAGTGARSVTLPLDLSPAADGSLEVEHASLVDERRHLGSDPCSAGRLVNDESPTTLACAFFDRLDVEREQ